MNYPPIGIRASLWRRALVDEPNKLWHAGRRREVILHFYEEDRTCWIKGKRGGTVHVRPGWYFVQADSRKILLIIVRHRDKPVTVYRPIIRVKAPSRRIG